MSSAILYVEVSAVCILVLLLISLKINGSAFLQSQRLGILLVAISNILLFALDAIWIFVDNNMLPISVPMNWLLNGAYYALSGLLGYVWFCFSESIQQSLFVRERKFRYAAMLPALALIVLTVRFRDMA